MEEWLKQRLVGAAVLVLLAVIFVPMLLDCSHEPRETGVDLRTPSSAEDGFSSRIVPLEESPGAAPEGAAGVATGSFEEEVPHGEEVPDGEEVTPAMEGAPDAGPALALVPEAPDGDEGSEPRAVESVMPPEEDEGAAQAPPAEWAAQIGSFSDRRNALLLRNRLRAKGYSAFLTTATGEQGELTRVLVGPDPIRDRTVSTIEALRRETGIDAFVVRYPRG